ncbi:serpin family protein [Nocardioides limicola]|uniref:serpin family protein n=1 Tax=Nocardioides limicola TaxID=2803368 RepID=UPI00193B9E68|nr:serpin family protein [Nocardioides sp. DJM-14]
MTLRHLLIGLAAVTTLAACGGGNGPSAASDPITADVERRAAQADLVPDTVGAVHRLAGAIVELTEEGDNLALSPYSIAVALAMTANGAGGETAEQMYDVLGLDRDALNAGLNALTQHVDALAGAQTRADGSEADLELEVANALFGHQATVWEPDFLATLAEYYGAGMNAVDWAGETEAARQQVNEWTAERTRDRIPEIVPEDAVDHLTRLILVNAIYLKAPWEDPFDTGATQGRPFTLGDGSTVDVESMQGLLDHSSYAADEGWQAVSMPYAGRGAAMTLVLPDEGQEDRVRGLVTGGELGQLLSTLSPKMVQLTWPKFEFRSQVPLKETLKQAGMPAAFERGADFLAMTTPENPDRERELRITDVLHEAFVAVDEEGTEAAAATAVVMGIESMPEFVEVTVDRPFWFLIHDTTHGTPLFIGHVTDPRAD